MQRPKYIREARMGMPKTYKTGAVVGTYPTPLLYMGFDRGGVDIIPSAASLAAFGPDLVKPKVTYEDIVFTKPSSLGLAIQKPMAEQPKILAVQYYEGVPMGLSLDYKPVPTQQPFQNFVNDYNQLTMRETLPWRTVVIDSITGLTDIILNHISSFNPNAMLDARQWAGMAGGKVRQTVLSATSLPAHFVAILHSFIDKNELTGEIREQPNVYSQTLRDDFFGLFSQVFYAAQENGKPVLWVSDKYPVKGIGPRWPVGLPKTCGVTFNEIYGKELGMI